MTAQQIMPQKVTTLQMEKLLQVHRVMRHQCQVRKTCPQIMLNKVISKNVVKCNLHIMQ